MQWLRNVSLALIITLISLLVFADVAYATSPSVDDVKVYTSYYETDDWLIVATYNISGGNLSDCTNTSCFKSPTYQWFIQFVDSTGTAITTNPIQQEGMRPFGISINATVASALVWGGNYSVKIYGAYGVTPNSSRALTAIDWRGEVEAGELDEWVIQQAQIMEDYHLVDYVTTVPVYNNVLTMDGGSIFNIGIPWLSIYRPNIFQVTSYSVPMGYTNSTGDTLYADALYDNWDVTLGPEVSGSLTTIAPYFGFVGVDGGRMIGALLTLLGFLSLAIIEKSVAFMVILGGVMIGVFPMATVIMVVFIEAVILVRSLFWSST